MPPMNRREAVKATTALLGGVLITSNGFLIACARDANIAAGKTLTLDDQSLIEEIADTLLPTTPSSPGAKAAGRARRSTCCSPIATSRKTKSAS